MQVKHNACRGEVMSMYNIMNLVVIKYIVGVGLLLMCERFYATSRLPIGPG